MRVDRPAHASLWLVLPGLQFIAAAGTPLAGAAACVTVRMLPSPCRAMRDWYGPS